MEIFKKITIFSLISAFIAVLSALIFLSDVVKERRFKEDFAKYAKRMKNLIYYEATKHNPKGDLLPDQIDDRIISETRNILK